MEIRYFNHIMFYCFGFIENDKTSTIDDYDQYKFPNVCINNTWCFSKLYSHLELAERKDKNVLISIKMYKKLKYFKEGNNHFYLFNYDDSILWLEEIKKIVDFEYKLISNSDEDFELRIFINASNLEVKFVTTLARALYEWPQAHMLKDAIEIKKEGLYEDISLFNLYNMMFMIGFNTSDGHNIILKSYCITKLLNYDEVKQRFSNRHRLNNAFAEGHQPLIDYKRFESMFKDGVNNKFIDSKKIEHILETAGIILDQLNEIDTTDDLFDYYNHNNSMNRFKEHYKMCFDFALKMINSKSNE